MAKINVDAALSKSGGVAAVGAVARDAMGGFLGASGLVIKGILDPETMEAEACREGIALAKDLYLTNLRLASDCQTVIRRINGGDTLGKYGQIVCEIKDTSTEFQKIEFAHEERLTNINAHNLARSCISLDLGRHVGFMIPPDGVCRQRGQQVSDALFSSPGYPRGLRDF